MLSPSARLPPLSKAGSGSKLLEDASGRGYMLNRLKSTEFNPPPKVDSYHIRQSIEIDLEDAEELRLSYAATELFMRPPLMNLIKNDPIGIIRRTWGIFQHQSKGNFWHWKALIERALASDWGRVCRFLLSRNCIVALIDHLAEPSIQDILLHNLLNGKDINAMRTEDRLAFFSTLSLAEFLPQLCERIYSIRSPPGLINNASIFFRRLLEDLAPCRDADRFFIKLGENNQLLGGLMEAALAENRTPLQQKECALCLECLFEISQRRIYTGGDFFDVSDSPTLQDNILQKIRGVFFRALRSFARPLSAHLVRVREKQPASLDSYILSLVNILAEMISFDTRNYLNQLPPAIWGVLVDWFFAFPFHNIYHKSFTRICCNVIKTCYMASLEQLLDRQSFVARMVAHYCAPEPSGCRGHIILLCNTLRLVADSQSPTSYLSKHLASNPAWQEFLPILTQHTEDMVQPLVAPPAGCLKALQWSMSAIQEGQKSSLSPAPENRIGLGSLYAAELGLGTLVPFGGTAPTALPSSFSLQHRVNSPPIFRRVQTFSDR